jgi:hypothetical protein
MSIAIELQVYDALIKSDDGNENSAEKKKKRPLSHRVVFINFQVQCHQRGKHDLMPV